MNINSLADLDSFRSAPKLSSIQTIKLFEELETYILNSDWITIGVMALHDYDAVIALKSVSKKFSFIKFRDLDSLHADGSVYLKGNQKTGNVYIRAESGLGEGILLTCHYDKDSSESSTFGPLPLNFFH